MTLKKWQYNFELFQRWINAISLKLTDQANLTDQEKYRLNEITKIENYFIEEIDQRKSCNKKISKYVTTFD